MTYEEATAYIADIPKFTEKHELSHTKEFLRRLGNPAMDRKIIHVAGTNGKGSVCAYMQAILLAMGKKTGFFTSPHLIVINERIRVNNIQIGNEKFLEIFRKVKKTVDGMTRDGIAHPSYFEFLFGMAMLAFEEEDTEYIILETGLGGRLDATNAIDHPVLTIITSISLDHTAYLGNTVSEIASEKAGIIKEGIPIIFDGTDEEASEIIRKRAVELHAKCRKLTKNAYEIREITEKHIAFLRSSAYDKDVLWNVRGCGIYQPMNVSLALEAMEYLLSDEERDYIKWQKAVESVTWEGRMEEILPGLFLDGAHNPGAVQVFADTLKVLKEEEPIILFSAVKDKEYRVMIEILCREVSAKRYIITEIEDDRKVSAEELAENFRKFTEKEVCVCPDPATALLTAVERKGSSRIFCLGSLYLIGQIRRIIKRKEIEINGYLTV